MQRGTWRGGPRVRPGDLFLISVILACLVSGAGIIALVRADLSKDMVATESMIVSSKISDYLWGKVLRFTAAAGRGTEGKGAAGPEGDSMTVAPVLPSGWNFQRIRSGTGEGLPVFIGAPRDLPIRGHVLPLAFLDSGGSGHGQRFIIGSAPLADIEGYLGDLRRRGILCRIVDSEGNTLFGTGTGFPMRRESATGPGGETTVMGGGLSREWFLQTLIPDAGNRLPILPQVILAAFFLSDIAVLAYLRHRFMLPAEQALAAIAETVAAQGEILPSPAPPGYIASAVTSILSRRRSEAEEEKRSIRESGERQNREISEAQKNLLAHHRLTKKMLQSREPGEVFDILIGGVSDGYGFPNSLIGKASPDGNLVFHGETDPVSGNPMRIPLFHPGSLLARTFWSGNLFHASPLQLPHLPEEEAILGSSPVLCLPLMRNPKVRCSETKNCTDRNCPAYYSENMRCWSRHIPPEFFTPTENPEKFRESITACLGCEVFPSAALLVVRSTEGGKAMSREHAVPIANLVSEAVLALEVVSLYDSMKVMAVTDGLTGLYNHREFYNSLRRELERARRYRHIVSLLMIDVDDFKRFNDRFGHPAGDIALRKVAELIRKCGRTSDIIARYGGEEFAVILPESTPGGALMVAERNVAEVGGYNFIPEAENPVNMTVSIGIYSSEKGEISEDEIVSLADGACYVAKTSGKNRIVVKTLK